MLFTFVYALQKISKPKNKRDFRLFAKNNYSLCYNGSFNIFSQAVARLFCKPADFLGSIFTACFVRDCGRCSIYYSSIYFKIPGNQNSNRLFPAQISLPGQIDE